MARRATVHCEVAGDIEGSLAPKGKEKKVRYGKEPEKWEKEASGCDMLSCGAKHRKERGKGAG